MMHSVKEFLLCWHGSFVRKKRKKSLVSSSFILIFDHLEGEIGERLKTLEKKKRIKISNIINVQFFGVRVYTRDCLLSMIDFIDWLSSN